MDEHRTSIEIQISFFGNLIRFRESRNEKSRCHMVAEGTTVGVLTDSFGIVWSELSTVTVNGDEVAASYILEQGDQLQLFSLLSGG